MEQVLDNPAYHAMMTGNRNLSSGSDTARYFPEAISPFVGVADFSDARFAELARIMPARSGAAVVVSPEEIAIPAGWKVNYHGVGYQMIGGHARRPARGPAPDQWDFVSLERKHVPSMVALAKLTNPGPFGDRTIEFGNFVGVFDGDRLIAMSGQRLHPAPYIEVSGVCTHPDYGGRGLGAALTYFQVKRIKEIGEIPILHVWANNVRAIRLYEHLGFATRRTLHFYMIQVV